jgi:NAD(P)-dependent dehydrogenase (short-subunit alcohol dehydrogenase family)
VQFAREGAAVAIGARTESYLEEVRKEVEDNGGRVVAVPTDIAEREHCERIIEAAVDAFGGVDTIVQNAFAVPPFARFEDADLATWKRAMDVTVWGSLNLAQAALPSFKAGGGGSIVFVNSMIMRKPLPFQGGYATTKGALLTASQVLARELGQYRIRVNSIAPGWMMGPSVDVYFEMMEAQGKPKEELYAEIASNIALGVIPTDEECVGAAIFLASDLASMVTGQTIDVNGGEVFF